MDASWPCLSLANSDGARLGVLTPPDPHNYIYPYAACACPMPDSVATCFPEKQPCATSPQPTELTRFTGLIRRSAGPLPAVVISTPGFFLNAGCRLRNAPHRIGPLLRHRSVRLNSMRRSGGAHPSFHHSFIATTARVKHIATRTRKARKWLRNH